MSSTSHEVCELWNGDAIVRVMGSAPIKELLFFEDSALEKKGTAEIDKVFSIFTLEEVITRYPGLLQKQGMSGFWADSFISLTNHV
jgi:hypothetical protein